MVFVGVSCRVAALGLASGMLLVLLLFCLYRVLCPKNYGQNGPGRRRRGDLPCDDYGYSPPETEIVPLVLRGHLMVRPASNQCIRKGCWSVEFLQHVLSSCWDVIFTIATITTPGFHSLLCWAPPDS